ncbi:MAG TPA: BatD family protein [Gemmatimonadaceae bacterium]|nr:BatD family protein [Gemmatimonadaceae bacterium]
MLAPLALFAQLSIAVSAPDSVGACAPLAITVELRAPGTEAPQLSLPDFRPFALVQSSARPRLETDARRGVWVSDQYRYTIATPRAGTYVIPPFVARLGQDVVRSAPLRVTVLAPEQSGGPSIVTRATIDHDRPVHFQAMALPETVYVGQQVTYQAAAFLEDSVQSRLRRNPEFFPPEMRAMLAYELPFVRAHLPRRDRANRCYEVPVFQRAIFPLVSGRHAIAPAQLIYTLPRSHSFFSREESHEMRTDSVIVVAVDPPPAGRPDDYIGAVGRFAIAARLDTNAARVGIPRVLTVRVEGEGNIRLLPRPIVALPWGKLVPGNERVEVTSDGIVGGAKEFDWILTPHESGQLAVPPQRYTYFDPHQGEYATAVSASLPIAVAPGTIASFDADATTPLLRLREHYRGALSEPVHARPEFWVILFAAPIPALALGVLRRPRRPPRRRTSAQRLRALARHPLRADARTLRRVFAGALSQRLALSALTMSRRGALVSALRKHGVSSGVAADAETLLVALDAVAFGRGSPRTADAAVRAWRIYEAVDREALPRPTARPPGTRPPDTRPPDTRSRFVMLLVASAIGASAGSATALHARSVNAPAARMFAQAIVHYQAREFHEAARMFGTAARLEPRAADAWANFGTAAWAAADTVDALIGWQRALRLEPTAGDVRHRLSLIHAALPGTLDEVPAFPAWPFAVLGAIFWVTACMLAFAWLRSGPRNALGLARAAALGALALGVIAWRVDRIVAGDDLLVAASTTPLRVLPALGAESSSSVGSGEVVRRLESDGVWVHVRTGDERDGWMERRRVIPLVRD